MSLQSRAPNPGQLAKELPGLNTYMTGHDPETAKAIIKESRPGNWQSLDNDLMAFNVVYTTSEFPAQLNGDVDIKNHDQLMASKSLGLVNPGGIVCRVVDFAPNYECMMHRTQSLDFGVVLEGTMEMMLDSGEVQVMQRGDVAIQRATMHAWRNITAHWARILFVLQDCKNVEVGGSVLKEDLGRGAEGLPPSAKAGEV